MNHNTLTGWADFIASCLIGPTLCDGTVKVSRFEASGQRLWAVVTGSDDAVTPVTRRIPAAHRRLGAVTAGVTA
jgi:hypothetical protein